MLQTLEGVEEEVLHKLKVVGEEVVREAVVLHVIKVVLEIHHAWAGVEFLPLEMVKEVPLALMGVGVGVGVHYELK